MGLFFFVGAFVIIIDKHKRQLAGKT